MPVLNASNMFKKKNKSLSVHPRFISPWSNHDTKLVLKPVLAGLNTHIHRNSLQVGHLACIWLVRPLNTHTVRIIKQLSVWTQKKLIWSLILPQSFWGHHLRWSSLSSIHPRLHCYTSVDWEIVTGNQTYCWWAGPNYVPLREKCWEQSIFSNVCIISDHWKKFTASPRDQASPKVMPI